VVEGEFVGYMDGEGWPEVEGEDEGLWDFEEEVVGVQDGSGVKEGYGL
jgi:hypothetical protein